MQKILLRLLLILIPFAAQSQVYQIYTGEYDCFVRNPSTKLLYDVVTAGTGPGKISPMAGNLVVADGDGKGSAALHHAAFIGADGFTYAWGDNTCNIAANGKGGTIGLTKTPVGNAKQVIAYANSGDGSSAGLGYGIATLTNDGKIVLTGNTQSGFRGDGTEGNAAEAAPYTITSLPVAIQKIQAGSYFFALGIDSKVYHWGGTRRDPYWSQFSCGGFTASPNLTKPTVMNLPEPIIDIEGGADWSYAVGFSGKIYAFGYDGRYWGNASQSQQLRYFEIAGTLGLSGKLAQLAIGTQATYALMTSGDLYAWGDNTQAQIGNGVEASFSGGVAPWNGGVLWVYPPVKVNPPGVQFVKVFTGIGDAFYVYAEDTNGSLWVWGRNKGFVLWNGIGGSSQQQSAQPNLWDVLAPTKIAGFGTVTPPPPANIPPRATISNLVTSFLSASGPDTLIMDGSKSIDPDGTISKYAWSILAGPPGAAVASGPTPIAIFPAAGIYTLQLTVTDNSGASNSTTGSVVVMPRTCPTPVPCPPTVVCPPARTVTAVGFMVSGKVVPFDQFFPYLIFTYSDGTTQ